MRDETPLECARMTDADLPFIGMPDDVARLAVQRFMAADVKARAHSRIAARWSRVETVLSVATAVAASLAAVSFLKSGWLGIAFSIVVAVLVPLQRSIGAAGRAADHRQAATAFPRSGGLVRAVPAARHRAYGMARRQPRISRMCDGTWTASTVRSAAGKEAPAIASTTAEQRATEVRGSHLIDYLSMSNVVMPPRRSGLASAQLIRKLVKLEKSIKDQQKRTLPGERLGFPYDNLEPNLIVLYGLRPWHADAWTETPTPSSRSPSRPRFSPS